MSVIGHWMNCVRMNAVQNDWVGILQTIQTPYKWWMDKNQNKPKWFAFENIISNYIAVIAENSFNIQMSTQVLSLVGINSVHNPVTKICIKLV